MVLWNFKPNIDELSVLMDSVSDLMQQQNFQVELILEEIFVNIVNYSNCEFIKVNANFEDNVLTLEFIDDGVEFNPLLVKEYESPDSIDDAKVGGLGIHLSKQFADELSYNYLNDENHLMITKNVK